MFKNSLMARTRARAFLLLALLALAGCGAGSTASHSLPQPTQVTVAVTPPTATATVGGDAVSFQASVVNATNTSVTWQVNGIDGGSSELGTISAAGTYLSPAVVPSSPNVTISAISVADPTRSGSATITLVTANQSVDVAIAPTTVTVRSGGGGQAFLATVTNASDESVTWQVNGVVGGNSTVGTISSSGVYTAPASVPAQPSLTVTAVSVADTTKSASATVTVTSQPVAVSVTVSPTSAIVAAGTGTQNFRAIVSASTNESVTWQVNGATGGNATVGTITTGGTYTAPASAPSPATVTVTAIAVVDPSKSASASVMISAASAVTVSVSPTSASVAAGNGMKTFTATVGGSTNHAVTWQVNLVTGGNATFGTISTSGVYTPPAVVPSLNPVTVTAIAAADTSKTASANVTITVPAPAISGAPGTSVMVGRAYDFKPTASDPSGLTLNFTIAGKPSWATFNGSTGELSGTPAAADVGSSSVTITVSNGSSKASLSFSLAVVQSATGSATINWGLPTLRTDGSALTNLASFKVYYGTSLAGLTSIVSVANPTVTSTVIPNLTSGTWYFSITSVDSAGVESAKSNPVSTTI